MKPVIVSTKNAEYFSWGKNCDGWHLSKHPSASILQERMLPRTSEIRHYHNKTWQFFYILSGVATLEIDGVNYELHAQEGIEIAAPVPHNIINNTDEDVTYILISVPNLKDDRINL